MTSFDESLRLTASYLTPHRDALLDAWTLALGALAGAPYDQVRADCVRTVDALLEHAAGGRIEAFLAAETEAAAQQARAGRSFLPLALSIRVFDRCCLPFLTQACADKDALGQALLALDELGDRRLELLLRAQEEENARRVIEAQEQAARAEERARETQRANEALRKARTQSQHRADQIALFNDVTRRLAPILDPERLLQMAAETMQARLGHMYVAVVVLDDEGVLVGRWAGRPGVDRRSSGRAQGLARGVIGRALRKRAPQVVSDVTRDPDYHADVPLTRSELVVPLLDAGEAVGAIDVQSDQAEAFDLDDVAAAEAVGEYLVVALRNARLFEDARRDRQAAE
jgi:putative methionine-R-sulfoxide reductase with GAF domain